jgi:hypothetical protein
MKRGKLCRHLRGRRIRTLHDEEPRREFAGGYTYGLDVADNLDEDDVKLLFRSARLDRPARMRIQEVATGLLRTVFLPDDCTINPIEASMHYASPHS